VALERAQLQVGDQVAEVERRVAERERVEVEQADPAGRD